MLRRTSPAPVGGRFPLVRTLRETLRLTQRQMADELGTRQQTVSEWETGIYRPPFR